MKMCSSCMTDKPEECFYKSKKGNLFGNCIDCMKVRQKEATVGLTPLDVPKTYMDYLKEQGQYEYYKKSLRYQI